MQQIPERVVTGGLVGQGVLNLLGRPQLEPMPLVLREAVQNSWDARKRKGRTRLRFSVRVRDLSPAQERAFRNVFDQTEALEPKATNSLAAELACRQPIRVLELSDFGTTGLSGQTRPDQPIEDGQSRFVNFLFDIGRAHEESGDGGTYGFGRSSLYTAGRASLIVVDSLTDEVAGSERRLIACRIGPAFEVRSSRGRRGRYSGRHFWGRERDGIPQPLTGSAALRMTERLGLPARDTSTRSGTTILIPWPVTEFDDPAAIESALLYHLWPKMVAVDGKPVIEFSIEVDGRSFPVRNPADTEEYRLFVHALERARGRTPGPMVEEISTLRPIHRTGYLGVAEGVMREQPVQSQSAVLDDDSGDLPVRALNSVALMRPSELVVRYLPVAGTERVGRAWAGVFICEDEELVRTAFALSEPPAHDDWIADRLKDRTQKYIVKKTRDALIPEAVRRVLGITTPGAHEESEDGTSLAGASARFSTMFLSGDGQGAALVPGSGESNGRGSARGSAVRHPKPKVSAPELLDLDTRNGIPVAVFGVRVRGAPQDSVVLRANPAIHGEGELDSLPEGLEAPVVSAWRGGVGFGSECRVDLPDGGERQVEIEVEFRGEYGVTLACTLVEEAAP